MLCNGFKNDTFLQLYELELDKLFVKSIKTRPKIRNRLHKFNNIGGYTAERAKPAKMCNILKSKNSWLLICYR